jgi:hypothetical protein
VPPPLYGLKTKILECKISQSRVFAAQNKNKGKPRASASIRSKSEAHQRQKEMKVDVSESVVDQVIGIGIEAQ